MGSGTSKSIPKKAGNQLEFVERETTSVPISRETDLLVRAEPPTDQSERNQQEMKVNSVPTFGPSFRGRHKTSGSRTATKAGNLDWKLSSLATGTITRKYLLSFDLVNLSVLYVFKTFECLVDVLILKITK